MITQEGNVHKLTVRLVGEMNAGKYNVQASNSAGVAGAHASLSITPKAPRFVSGTGPYVVTIGTPCAVDVHVVGYPHPTVTWERKVSGYRFVSLFSLFRTSSYRRRHRRR